MSAARPSCSMIPALRYRDAPAAIDFLCRAFGFSRHLVVPGETAGTVAHAQLTLGSGMIMLGSDTDDGRQSEYGRLIRRPGELGGFNTQSTYVVVPEIDSHYARAVEQGAEILMELKPQDYGGKLYTCRDPEGHVWNFGSYDPWAPPAEGVQEVG
ncbi:VOC family protein [Ferrovibrio xuzhouensis]|uniref:VOC family protein n=1 Tax=Ferrovibrio xuzhouensis TaxID=1576914 RepID=A0ABV7VF13_9PROT